MWATLDNWYLLIPRVEQDVYFQTLQVVKNKKMQHTYTFKDRESKSKIGNI
jgi:hypothetical protein